MMGAFQSPRAAMPTEIPASRPPLPTTAIHRSGGSEAVNSLRMLDNLPQQLVAGQQLQAQVVAAREAAQLFQVLLKMQMPDGQQATLQAQSTQPLNPGQLLALTAISGQHFSFTPVNQAPQVQLTQFNPEQFPAGSQIQARVLAMEPTAQGQFRITLTLNSGAQAGQHFVVESPKALAVNSLVSAQVNGRFELALVSPKAGFERLAVQQELGGQFMRQGSPAQALQQLIQLSASAGSSQTTASATTTTATAASGLSSEAIKVVQQLISNLPSLGSKPDAGQIAELIKNSGILMESRLHAEQASQQDIKANLLRLVAQLLPQQPHANPLGAATQAALTSQALPQLLRELGGAAASAREQALRFPVTSRILEKLDNPNDLGSLLRLAAAAISRLQTHQLASLAQTYTTPEGTQLTTWQTEIPMRNQDDVVPLQVRFQQEQHNPADSQEQRPPVWRLELSFELEPLGPLHVQVNLQEDNLSSRLWAKQENTVELINKELHVLRDKLLAAGLNIRELECEQGIPPAAPNALLEQRWIDDLA